MSFIRAVLGDISPDDLGRTACHEHLVIDSAFIAARFPHIHLPSVDDAVAELAPWRDAGLGAVVDAMPAGQGRDVARLAEISRRSGVHVIATTGLHTEKYYDHVPWARRDASASLVQRFTREIVDGADGTGHRCGVIKVATGPDGITSRARRLFAAAAETHRRTGVPILTHCEEGRGGLEQIELLRGYDVPLGRVALSHTDRVADLTYHRDVLASGVSLVYDQALRQSPSEPRGTAWLLAAMVEEGHGSRLMLGTDGARRTLWTTLGGSPGLAWLFTGFAKVLARHGVDAAKLATILVDNPARWLTFDSTDGAASGLPG